MTRTPPLVSIGMPTRNGESFIRQALDSLLAQEYDHVELIISDNASTDNTGTICREYEKRDPRVSYARNEVDVGAAQNFNSVFGRSTGKYFMWAGDHDVWEPSFISRCVAALEENPEAALAYPRASVIDVTGKVLRLTPCSSDSRGMRPFRRYMQFLRRFRWCTPIYGLMRRSILVTTPLFEGTAAPDRVLLGELCLKGPFVHVPETLFSLRRNRPDEKGGTQAFKKRLLEALDPATAPQRGKRSVNRLRMEVSCALMSVVARSSMNWFERLVAILATRVIFRPSMKLLSKAGRAIRSLIRRLFARAPKVENESR